MPVLKPPTWQARFWYFDEQKESTKRPSHKRERGLDLSDLCFFEVVVFRIS
jgi:hypothetical protein